MTVFKPIRRLVLAAALIAVGLTANKRVTADVDCDCVYYTENSGYYYYWCSSPQHCDDMKIPCGIDACGDEQRIEGEPVCGDGGSGLSLLEISCGGGR